MRADGLCLTSSGLSYAAFFVLSVYLLMFGELLFDFIMFVLSLYAAYRYVMCGTEVEKEFPCQSTGALSSFDVGEWKAAQHASEKPSALYHTFVIHSDC